MENTSLDVNYLGCVVRPERLEPLAYWFEANRSIQLSYGRTMDHY